MLTKVFYRIIMRLSSCKGVRAKLTRGIYWKTWCLELLRRGYEVFVGHLADGEVDFVAQNADGHAYYQVAATVLDEASPYVLLNTRRLRFLALQQKSGAI